MDETRFTTAGKSQIVTVQPIRGCHTVRVCVDALDNVEESGDNANNCVTTPNVGSCGVPDLAVTHAGVSAKGVVSFTVANLGDGDVDPRFLAPCRKGFEGGAVEVSTRAQATIGDGKIGLASDGGWQRLRLLGWCSNALANSNFAVAGGRTTSRGAALVSDCREIRVCVDPFNVVFEPNEANNCFELPAAHDRCSPDLGSCAQRRSCATCEQPTSGCFWSGVSCSPCVGDRCPRQTDCNNPRATVNLFPRGDLGKSRVSRLRSLPQNSALFSQAGVSPQSIGSLELGTLRERVASFDLSQLRGMVEALELKNSVAHPGVDWDLSLFEDTTVSLLAAAGNSEWLQLADGDLKFTSGGLRETQLRMSQTAIHGTVWDEATQRMFEIDTLDASSPPIVRIREFDYRSVPEDQVIPVPKSSPLLDSAAREGAQHPQEDAAAAADVLQHTEFFTVPPERPGLCTFRILLIVPSWFESCSSFRTRKNYAKRMQDTYNNVFTNPEPTGVLAHVMVTCVNDFPTYEELSTFGWSDDNEEDIKDVCRFLRWSRKHEPWTTERNAHKADGVMVIIPDAWRDKDGNQQYPAMNGCGCGYMPELPLDAGDENSAWGTAMSGCAITGLTAMHETGHNFGMFHDRQAEDAWTDERCNYGFIHPENKFRSVLAYNSGCDCPRKPFFSHILTEPGEDIKGVACNTPAQAGGTYTRSNNRQVLLDNALTACAFRPEPYILPQITFDLCKQKFIDPLLCFESPERFNPSVPVIQCASWDCRPHLTPGTLFCKTCHLPPLEELVPQFWKAPVEGLGLGNPPRANPPTIVLHSPRNLWDSQAELPPAAERFGRPGWSPSETGLAMHVPLGDNEFAGFVEDASSGQGIGSVEFDLQVQPEGLQGGASFELGFAPETGFLVGEDGAQLSEGTVGFLVTLFGATAEAEEEAAQPATGNPAGAVLQVETPGGDVFTQEVVPGGWNGVQMVFAPQLQQVELQINGFFMGSLPYGVGALLEAAQDAPTVVFFQGRTSNESAADANFTSTGPVALIGRVQTFPTNSSAVNETCAPISDCAQCNAQAGCRWETRSGAGFTCRSCAGLYCDVDISTEQCDADLRDGPNLAVTDVRTAGGRVWIDVTNVGADAVPARLLNPCQLESSSQHGLLSVYVDDMAEPVAVYDWCAMQDVTWAVPGGLATLGAVNVETGCYRVRACIDPTGLVGPVDDTNCMERENQGTCTFDVPSVPVNGVWVRDDDGVLRVGSQRLATWATGPQGEWVTHNAVRVQNVDLVQALATMEQRLAVLEGA